ncbi:RNA 3'-terminal phosphate cyclase domain-containing protein [Crassisporium funariophilum]|nr:RNA 3'-terminal phosphate cyclase domain-containing protein [Crassisporium funariophilum]
MARTLIDGSFLEGGGQILRNSVSLSALLNKPVSIHKIRNNRNPPGLKNQHRTGKLRLFTWIELAAKIANARLTGAQTKSQEIDFTPGRISLPGQFHADSVTAGSITLLLQVALPLLLFSPTPVEASNLTLLGGTNASLAPQVDYTQQVFLPFIKKHCGVGETSLHIAKRGYFPKGGGKVTLSVVPLSGDQKLRSFSLMERGKVLRVGGIAHYAGLPNVVGTGMVNGAKERLAMAGFVQGDNSRDSGATSQQLLEHRDVPVLITSRREPRELTTGAGSGIVLWAELEGGGVIGGSAVGTKGLDPEKVGEQAVDELIKGLNEGGCVDEWMQDQIIIFMALADGKSEVRCGTSLSLHTQTAIWLAQELTDAKFEVEEEPSGTVVIRCQGIGYTAPPADSTDTDTNLRT